MLKNRTWFTENTEILTINGWINIKNMSQIQDVIVVDDVIKGEKIIEYNRAYYRGKVKEYKGKDIYCKGKNIFFYENIWRVDSSLPIPDFKEVDYKGFIFNLVTSSNTLITRSTLKSGNDDYILSLCRVI